MPIVQWLPPAVVWPICGFLDPASCLSLRLSSTSIYACLCQKAADEAIWKGRCWRLAACYDVSLFSKDVCWSDPSWWVGLTSHMQLYFWAHKVLPLLGLWRWDKSAHGGVLVVRAHAGMVLSSLIKPVHEPHFYVSAAVHFSSRTLFRLEPMQRFPLPPKASNGANGSGTGGSANGGGGGSGGSGGGVILLAAGMLEVPSACTEDGRMCEVVKARGVVSFMPPLPADAPPTFHENHPAPRLMLAYQATCRDYRDAVNPPVSSEEAGCEKFDRLPTPQRLGAPPPLPLPLPSPPGAFLGNDAAFAELAMRIPGLYFAVYGPHGLELISVGWADMGGGGAAAQHLGAPQQLRGLKATGDVNVPAGRLTFKSVAPLRTPPFDVPPCTCGFECECFSPAELSQITLLGKMDAQARTAQTGFVNPTWNDATIVLFDAREEWAHYSRDAVAARGLEAPIRALAAPTGCSETVASCSVGILVIWRGEGFSTSMRFRPFCP